LLDEWGLGWDKTLPANTETIYQRAGKVFSVMALRGIVGSILAAFGGMLLFLALYLVLYTALYQYFDPTSGLASAMLFGFIGFWLIAYGLSLIIKSVEPAVSS
jgi:hypothetical protein